MKDFSEKIKKALKEKKMTKGALCEKIGMSIDGFKSMEDNNTIKVVTLEKICEVLDLPIDYFLDIPIKSSPVGFWKRLVDEATAEAQRWKIRAYELEEQMGVGNFHNVSERRGVFNAKNRKPVFLAPNYLRFHLHK